MRYGQNEMFGFKVRFKWMSHDDVIKSKHFFVLLALCAGNSPVTGEFSAQRPVTRSFDIFFGLRLNKRLSKHSWGWWFETPSHSLWRHCNVYCDSGSMWVIRNLLGWFNWHMMLFVSARELTPPAWPVFIRTGSNFCISHYPWPRMCFVTFCHQDRYVMGAKGSDLQRYVWLRISALIKC